MRLIKTKHILIFFLILCLVIIFTSIYFQLSAGFLGTIEAVAAIPIIVLIYYGVTRFEIKRFERLERRLEEIEKIFSKFESRIGKEEKILGKEIKELNKILHELRKDVKLFRKKS